MSVSRYPPERALGNRPVGRAIMSLVLCGALAACGGGIYVGFDLGGPNDRPPSVALTSNLSDAVAGATVRLAAAATDDFGVDQVAFYREEGNGAATLLGVDTAEPYQFDATIPISPVGTVWRYFARATDGVGQRTDSALVSITVR